MGNPHQFKFWRYIPKAKGYPNSEPYFIFHCVICGRERYCVDPEGEVEFEYNDALEEEEKPEPRPKSITLHVCIDALAEDGSLRRISSHAEVRDVSEMSDERMAEFRAGLQQAAWLAFDAARNFEIEPPAKEERE